MAARRRTRTVYRRARRAYTRRRSMVSGPVGNVLIGAGAGLVSPYIPNVLGQWTKPILFAGAGYVFKKPALMAIGGYELGRSFTLGNAGAGGGMVR